MIDKIGICIIIPMQVAPGVEFRPRQVLVIGDSHTVLLKLQPVGRDIIMDHVAKHMVQRLILADMLCPSTDHRTDFRFGNTGTPLRVNDDRLLVPLQTGWRFHEKVGNAGIPMRLFHQFLVVEGDTQYL